MFAIEIIKELGLSNVEATVYYTLARAGPSSAGELISSTHLHKATMYVTLAGLQSRGLVSTILRGKVKTWQATDPEILLKQLKEREVKLKSILSELHPVKKVVTFAKVLDGKEGIKMLFRDLLNYHEYYHLLPGVEMERILGTFFYQFQTLKRKNHIKSKALISESFRKRASVKAAYSEVRYLDQSYESPVGTLIFGENIAIIVWSTLTVLMLENSDAAKSYRKYFETLWKIAKL